MQVIKLVVFWVVIASIYACIIGDRTMPFRDLQGDEFAKMKIVNVQAYEAVGDGTTDDTSAIQAAIDAAGAAGGGFVFFPPGVYITTATITVNEDNVRLIGSGEGACIIRSTVAGEIIYFNSDYVSVSQLNSSIESLTIEGDATNTTVGIKMDHCVNEGVYIRDVKVTKCDTQIYLDNCWFMHMEWVRMGRNAYGSYGLYCVNSNSICLDHCSASLMAAGSVGFYLSNAEGCVITNCDTESVETAIEIYDSSLNAGGILIDSLYAEVMNASGNTGSWIILGNAGASNSVRNVTIQNCRITGGISGGTVTFIDCVRAEDVVIDNNTLYTTYPGVHVKTTANTKNVVFTSTNQIGTTLYVTDTGNAIFYKGHNEGFYIPASAMYTVSGSPVLGRDLSYCSSAFQWSASGSGTNEYHLQAAGGGDPGVPQVDAVYENGSAMSSGAPGSLNAGEYGWGDNDSLGYNTIYVRLTDETDPDGKANDFITGTSGINSFQAWKMPDGTTSEIGFTARLPEAWSGTDCEVGVYVFYCTPHGSNNVVLSAVPTGLSDGDDMRSGAISSASGSESTNDYERKSLTHGNWRTTFNRGDILNVTIRRTGGGESDTSDQSCYILGAEVRLLHW